MSDTTPNSFEDELNHLLHMVESDVGEAWQQLRDQAARVRSLMPGAPAAPPAQ